MTNPLIPFLRDTLRRITPFSNIISYIHIKQLANGQIVAKASASDGSLHFTTTSVDDTIYLADAKLCLGNLMYLSNLINSSMVLENDTTVALDVMERNDKVIVSGMQFIPHDRLQINYVPTDPFRASITGPKRITVPTWPAEFLLDTATIVEITDLKKIHAAAPSIGKEDVIELSMSPSAEVLIDFGVGGDATSHTSSILLDVEGATDADTALSVYLLSDQFLRTITQFKTNDAVEIHMADKAIKMIAETTIATHEVILVGRKIRDE